jgi:outer membrane protein assembly factor BamA
MLRAKKYQLSLIALFFNLCRLAAQEPGPASPVETPSIAIPDSLVTVGEITVTGNKKTKDMIVLREIPFRTGEAYPLDVLVKKFEQGRKQLMNTALFNHVVVAAGHIDGNTIHVVVEVKERWYIFPIPHLKPVDRNLNQWLFEQKASLERVNYGMRLSYKNFTGRNDNLKLGFVAGYTRQISVSYDRYYIDNELKWGMKFAFATGKNRELNYNTINDKQVFLKDENDYVRNFTTANVELNYRRAIKTRHSLGVSYVNEQISDTIVALNPIFYKSGRKSVSYPGIYYNLSYLNLDFNPYPTRGYAAQLYIGKSGMNNIINIWQLHVKGLGVWPVSEKSFINVSFYGGVKLPFRQPYFSKRFFGYGDTFMQGFEYFVIDGVAGGYVKAGLTRELLDFSVKTPPRKKGKEGERIPVRIFGRVFGNSGYVHNPQPGENSLSNRMLYAGGVGIDVLCFYDVTLRFEWTFNSLGQNGIFLHRKTIF